jgi:hypothetical protein
MIAGEVALVGLGVLLGIGLLKLERQSFELAVLATRGARTGEPNVGLALDPEWKLGPRQRPLRQIGSVTAGEINGVSRWLAALTAREHLPQKVLVLHQFRLSMITGEQRLDTRHGDLAIVIHMDGQGTPHDKQQTWQAATHAAPPEVFFGWKNFYTKDHPMLSPRQTTARTPQPVMISYQ